MSDETIAGGLVAGATVGTNEDGGGPGMDVADDRETLDPELEATAGAAPRGLSRRALLGRLGALGLVAATPEPLKRFWALGEIAPAWVIQDALGRTVLDANQAARQGLILRSGDTMTMSFVGGYMTDAFGRREIDFTQLVFDPTDQGREVYRLPYGLDDVTVEVIRTV
jgi:hypothetical protein